MENRIHLLNPHVAERIAAGEVIERPASIVKELLENSLDAGATEVVVTLEDGGKSLIEITDNGYGMSPSDLALCIERHATSKLSSLEDLDRIHTLGFRGEALPSIAAVTDLNIISRAQNGDSAYELNASEIAGRLEQKPTPHKTTFGHFNATPHGTRFQARGIFSQIPARLKFLKSQAAEVSQVREWMERLALAYPKVGFKLNSNDRAILNLRPQEEKDRVRTILADDDDYPIITGSNDQDGFRDVGLQVRVHWLQGLSCPNSRKLVQVVNSRAVRDRMLQQAILAPFKQALLPGQFPAVALFVEVNPAALDVNVHPTKTEVRFLDSRKIFHTIDSTIKKMISKEGAPARAPSQWNMAGSNQSWRKAEAAEAGASWKSQMSQSGFSTMDNQRPLHLWQTSEASNESSPLSETYSGNPQSVSSSFSHSTTLQNSNVEHRESLQHPAHSTSINGTDRSPLTEFQSQSRTQVETPSQLRTQSEPQSQLHTQSEWQSQASSQVQLQQSQKDPKYEAGTYYIPNIQPNALNNPASPPHSTSALNSASPFNSASPLNSARHIGVLFNTYIMYEKESEIILIDQHAAHERIRYEKLRQTFTNQNTETQELPSQSLLIPEAVKIQAESRSLIEERLPSLSRLGFEAEIFGEDSILFRAVPADWGLKQLKPRLKNLIEKVLLTEGSEHSILLDETLFEALASQACHSAIRAGDRLEEEEVKHLAQELFQCEHPWNCPHGRPTVVKVPQGKLEEWFQRKI